MVQFDGHSYHERLSARISHSWGQKTSEATVTMPLTFSKNVGLWSKVNIVMGGSIGGAQTRFIGYVMGFQHTLYPGQIEVRCQGPLVKAKWTRDKHQNGTNLAGQTDVEIVEYILSESGLLPGEVFIEGNGYALGTTQTDPADRRFYWEQRDTGQHLLAQYDEISAGYRTHDTAGGTIHRSLVVRIPGSNAAFDFTEGVDMITATANVDLKKPKSDIAAKGWNGAIFHVSERDETMDVAGGLLVYELMSPKIESSLMTDGVGISAEELARYTHSELKKCMVKVQFTTPRDEFMAPGMTIRIAAPNRLEVDQNLYIQGITTEVDETNTFTQTINCVSDLGDGRPPEKKGTPFPPPTRPEIPLPTVHAGIGIMAIELERVIEADALVDLFVVYAEDTSWSSSAPIATRLWGTSGGGGASVTSGTGKIFVTAFRDLASAVLTLTVTDTLGGTSSISKALTGGGGAAIKCRKIYTAAGAVMEAFDGGVWRTQPASDAGTVMVVSDGPIAGTGPVASIPTCAAPSPGGPTEFFMVQDGIDLYSFTTSDLLYTLRGTLRVAGRGNLSSSGPLQVSSAREYSSGCITESTTDGGTTVAIATTDVIPSGDGLMFSGHVNHDGSILAFCYQSTTGTIKGVYRSTDGGATFTQITTPGVFDSGAYFGVGNSSAIYYYFTAPFFGAFGIYRIDLGSISDPGTGLDSHASPASEWVALFTAKYADVVLATGLNALDGNRYYVYRCTESEMHDVTPGFAGNPGEEISWLCSSDGVTWLGEYDSGAGTQLMRSTDSGDTWTLIAGTEGFHGGIAIGNTGKCVCMHDDGFLRYSLDNGVTWLTGPAANFDFVVAAENDLP